MIDVDYAYFALRSHFLARPGELFTLQQAHELWNRWPDSEQPPYLTEKALEALEREGILWRHSDIQSQTTWQTMPKSDVIREKTRSSSDRAARIITNL